MLTSRSSETAPAGASTLRAGSLRHLRAAGLSIACAGALLLTACAAEETEQEGAPETAPEGTDAPTGEEAGERELPDPDETDLERSEELGAFFSEEEACMTVGTTLDGLHEDMTGGIESQEDLEEAYEAVEQTYILVPEELRTPLEEILTELDTDHEELEEETVLNEMVQLEEWMDETCDGEYHNQDHGDEPVGGSEDEETGDA